MKDLHVPAEREGPMVSRAARAARARPAMLLDECEAVKTSRLLPLGDRSRRGPDTARRARVCYTALAQRH